jgi:hypothetical protein
VPALTAFFKLVQNYGLHVKPAKRGCDECHYLEARVTLEIFLRLVLSAWPALVALGLSPVPLSISKGSTCMQPSWWMELMEWGTKMPGMRFISRWANSSEFLRKIFTSTRACWFCLG